MNQPEIYRYDGILRPQEGHPQKNEWVPNGVIATMDGEIIFAGAFEQTPEALSVLVQSAVVQNGIAIPTTANMHQHAFQPLWQRDELIYEKDGEVRGSLLAALRSETVLRQQPQLARDIAHELCDDMIENGIAEIVLYTTGSTEALEIMLEVMVDRGFKGRAKLGYAFMNQNMNKYGDKDIAGVDLQLDPTEEDQVFQEIGRLNQKYPGMITMIDRFPIAVNSALRQRIVAFCSEHALDFDTHVDESEGEANLTAILYGGRRIMQILEDDGVFSLKADSQTIRLAHGIHTNASDFERLKRVADAGCHVMVAACPSSNLNIRSHWVANPATGRRDDFVSFPFEEWAKVGNVRLGIDGGAGLGRSIFQEMRDVVIRDPYAVVSWQDALNAGRSERSTLRAGAPADWLHVHPAQAAIFAVMSGMGFADSNLRVEEITKHCIVGASGNRGIEAMYLGGQEMQAKPRAERPKLA